MKKFQKITGLLLTASIILSFSACSLKKDEPVAENNKPENVELLKQVITKMGFSKITLTNSDDHDNKIGFTSQLCHVVASAMVESAENDEITSFGGGSFEDLTRIAMINAPLWTELFISNKEKLVAHIQNFKDKLTQMENLIQNQDEEALKEFARLAKINPNVVRHLFTVDND